MTAGITHEYNRNDGKHKYSVRLLGCVIGLTDTCLFLSKVKKSVDLYKSQLGTVNADRRGSLTELLIVSTSFNISSRSFLTSSGVQG